MLVCDGGRCCGLQCLVAGGSVSFSGVGCRRAGIDLVIGLGQLWAGEVTRQHRVKAAS